jgi:membrane fusion protein (multidrug efflux system)
MEKVNAESPSDQAASSSKSKKFGIILAAIVIAGGTYGVIKYMHGQHHEETDNAQVESFMSPVIPRVAGYIKEVRVYDNETVKKGDTLVILEDQDFANKLQQAEAALAAASGNATVAKAGIGVVDANVNSVSSNVATIQAQIEAAKVILWRADQDLARYENLIQDHSITQQQYEQAQAAQQTAQRQLGVLQAQQQSANKQTSAADAQKSVTNGQIAVANATIQQRQADIDAAKINLNYTVIVAATDGQISKVNLQPGQFVQAGQSLFNIVQEKNKWVVANFKETQLTKMKVGQAVTLKVDAYPDHEFKAKVASFSPATGSKFSLLPPDNASGNFVKVVQRLPVKIEFDNAKDEKIVQLRSGMNVKVDVYIP